mgnify:CR=1 FL=1
MLHRLSWLHHSSPPQPRGRCGPVPRQRRGEPCPLSRREVDALRGGAGRELAVVAWRLERIASQIDGTEFLGKFSGATGTWSAHLAADPDADWPTIAREYIEGLGLGFNLLTTQIESHDWQARYAAKIAVQALQDMAAGTSVTPGVLRS